MSLYDGTMYQLPYDSIRMNMTIDSQMVMLDDVTLSNEYTELRLKGSLDYNSYPQRLSIDDLDLELMTLPFVIDS
jgi:hypothetical protein